MKKILLPFGICLLTLTGFAQIDKEIVTYGSSESHVHGPLYRSSATSNNYWSVYSYLWEASELNIPTGTVISKIAFKKSNDHVITGDGCTVNIFMRNTDKTLFDVSLEERYDSLTDNAKFTTVYASTTDNITGAADTWVEYTLTTPFTYTGDAIQITYDFFMNIGAGATSPSSPGGNIRFYREDSGTSTQKAVGENRSSAFSASSDTDPNNSDRRVATRITYSLQAPQALNCTSGTSTVVYTEEFDDLSTNGFSGDLYLGSGSRNGLWNSLSGSTGSGSTGPDAAYSGSNYMYFESSSGTPPYDETAVTPAINLTNAVADAEVSLWIYAYGNQIGTFTLGVSTSAAGPFTSLFSNTGEIQADGAQSWINIGADLSAYVGQTIYISFNQVQASSGSRGDFAVDKLEISACMTPATYTFNGSWNTDPSGLANSLDIINVSSGDAVLTANTSCNTLTMEPGATLTVNDGFALEVNGTGTIKADATAYAQVLGSVSATGSGVINWQTYLNDGERWYNNAFATDGSQLSDVTGITVNTTAGQENVYSYSESTGNWTAVTNNTVSTDNIAYQMYGSANYGGTPVTVEVSGTSLKNGNQVIPVTNSTDGFNFVPNPYPSILNWKNVYDEVTTGANALSNNVGATIYINDGVVPTVPNSYTYTSYNAASNTGTNGGRRYLAPGQAFFMSAGAAGNLTLTNDFRSISQSPNPALLKTASTVSVIKLAAKDVINLFVDETVLGLDAAFQNAENAQDGSKLLNYGAQNLYTQIGSKPFVHNNRSDQFTTLSEDLFFENANAGTFEISISEDRLPSTWTVELEDKITGTRIDLKTSAYTFTHTVGNVADRFVLHINKNAGSVGLKENTASTIFAYTTNSTLYVNMLQFTGNANLTVFDVNGRTVAKVAAQGGEITEVDMSNLAKGLYIAKLNQAGKDVFTQKVIK